MDDDTSSINQPSIGVPPWLWKTPHLAIAGWSCQSALVSALLQKLWRQDVIKSVGTGFSSVEHIGFIYYIFIYYCIYIYMVIYGFIVSLSWHSPKRTNMCIFQSLESRQSGCVSILGLGNLRPRRCPKLWRLAETWRMECTKFWSIDLLWSLSLVVTNIPHRLF